ncbi:MAG: DUF763 domain-containing protein [Candidatus Micrarchaeota archaeon]|nr:DUF763 domain-containing protein [Candidatus Micrarchaeota archaeon]
MHSATVLPLHGGRAPRWLFGRMVRLSERISNVIIDEFGADELLRRLSDKDWFQALACAIGYDWHSSGTTTVTIGALKEALNDGGEIFIAGGKGKAGNNTPDDIREGTGRLSISSSAEKFVENSRLAAKIDAGMVYDNIGIYHHSFLFTRSGKWSVVQQAMQHEGNKAIRFQWFSELVDEKDVANEPHSGLETNLRQKTLDLTSETNAFARQGMPAALEEYKRVASGGYPDRHGIIPQIDISRKGIEAIRKASEVEPKDYRELLLVKGFGRSSIRSLAFVASLIYGKELAYRDPIAYAYNLGGKDGIPFPVNRRTYDSVIKEMDYIIDKANIEQGDRYRILKKLNAYLTN